jgi:general stress protein YciG
MEQNQQETKKSGIARRGFASLNSEERKLISSKGGHAAHKKGTAHKFSPEEAKLAGRKGGEKTSQNRAYMAEIGKKGGEASHAGRNNRQEVDGRQYGPPHRPWPRRQ